MARGTHCVGVRQCGYHLSLTSGAGIADNIQHALDDRARRGGWRDGRGERSALARPEVHGRAHGAPGRVTSGRCQGEGPTDIRIVRHRNFDRRTAASGDRRASARRQARGTDLNLVVGDVTVDDLAELQSADRQVQLDINLPLPGRRIGRYQRSVCGRRRAAPGRGNGPPDDGMSVRRFTGSDVAAPLSATNCTDSG